MELVEADWILVEGELGVSYLKKPLFCLLREGSDIMGVVEGEALVLNADICCLSADSSIHKEEI